MATSVHGEVSIDSKKIPLAPQGQVLAFNASLLLARSENSLKLFKVDLTNKQLPLTVVHVLPRPMDCEALAASFDCGRINLLERSTTDTIFRKLTVFRPKMQQIPSQDKQIDFVKEAKHVLLSDTLI